MPNYQKSAIPVSDALVEAERLSEEQMLEFVQQSAEADFVLKLRLEAATFAGDKPQIESLTSQKVEQSKYTQFYTAELLKVYPKAHPAPPDLKLLTQRVAVNDALLFTQLKTNAGFQVKAALYTGNTEHAALGQADVDKAVKYLAFYQPKIAGLKKN